MLFFSATARKLLAASVLLFVAVQAFAAVEDDAYKRLISAKSLRCTLGAGSVVDWSSGKPRVKNDTFNLTIYYDSIDAKKHKARAIGRQLTSDTTLYLTQVGMTFVEQTESGDISIATVFSDYRRGSKEYMAVYSRHNSIIGSPAPSQYHGSCEVLE
jgi:hypothetical protein